MFIQKLIELGVLGVEVNWVLVYVINVYLNDLFFILFFVIYVDFFGGDVFFIVIKKENFEIVQLVLDKLFMVYL